jgi:hypothetical protein
VCSMPKVRAERSQPKQLTLVSALNLDPTMQLLVSPMLSLPHSSLATRVGSLLINESLEQESRTQRLVACLMKSRCRGGRE